MNDEQNRGGIKSYYDSVAASYGDRYRKENLWSHPKYPANYFRHQILLQRLNAGEVKRIYEVGVGEGTPLAMLAGMGFDVAGCDVSSEMVKIAGENVAKATGGVADIIEADIEDSVTLASQLGRKADVVVAFGVLPHVAKPRVMLDNVRMLMHGRGKAFIEFRNALFSLFSLNRRSRDFIMNELLAGVADDVRSAVAAELEKRVDMEHPPQSKPGEYEGIVARFHIPFELESLFSDAGFRNMRIHWYHYHPALPSQEAALGRRFREEAFKLEHSNDWRGMFLCSAGVVEADIG